MQTMTADPTMTGGQKEGSASFRLRELPMTEWPRLAGTALSNVWPHLTPRDARLVVVERDGVIVGCVSVLRVVHVECVWIAKPYRTHTAVARQLLRGMRRAARAFGAARVMAGAMDDRMRALLRTHFAATMLPGEQYMFELGEDQSCRLQ